jgi:Mg/Co/Ni transporter MgtE
METHKMVKDIMGHVLDFPFAPNWCTVRQAIEIIEKAAPQTESTSNPIGLLVFDEKNNLLGSLGIREILKGLEPKFLSPVKGAQVHEESEAELSLIWDSMFDTQAMQLADQKVSDCMVPIRHFVRPDDPVTRAAYLMVHHDLTFLPVLEGGRKLVGVVKIFDVFRELSSLISNA